MVWNDHRGPALTRGKVLTVLVPSELVLLVVVDLPVASHRQRLSALPFALEGKLAEPLETVHAVLGPKVAPNRYLAAAVRRDQMADWARHLGTGIHSHARLLPDVLTVPRPTAENRWTVWLRGTRALVRQGDGSGFVVPVAALASAWKAAGKPEIDSYGGALPDGLPGRGEAAPAPPRSVDPVSMGFDLRQGAFAIGGETTSRTWLRAASFVLIAGVAAHGAIAAADVSALQTIAGEKRAALGSLLQQVAPGALSTDDPVAALTRLLPRDGIAPGGAFLPLLAQASAALGPMADGLSIRTLTYSAEDGTLNLTVEADDLAALQSIETALTRAGLSPVSGAATTGQGRAEARIALRAPAGGV